MALANAEHPAPSRSRIHKARHLVGELRRLRGKFERAHALAQTEDERRFCLSAADKLDALILAGDAVLGGVADPRDSQRVKKRETEWC